MREQRLSLIKRKQHVLLMEMENLEMCGRNAKCVTKVIATNVTEHHDETEKIH